MLISFSVTNFKSIKEKVTFSMEAVGKVSEFPEHIIGKNKRKLLRAAIIYGRNSAGKSNLIEALASLHKLSKAVGGIESGDRLKKIDDARPFKLDGHTVIEPTSFEINFISSNDIEYIYFVEFNTEKILTERLEQKKLLKPIFERKGAEIVIKRKEIEDQLITIEKGLFSNQTVISKLGTEKIDELLPVYKFFSETLFGVNFNHSSFSELSMVPIIFLLRLPQYAQFSSKFNQFVRLADLGIEKFEIVPKSQTDEISSTAKLWENINKTAAEGGLGFKIVFIHKDKNGNAVSFDFSEESSGTQKFFHVAFWALTHILKNGVLYLDEMDQSIHPQLTRLLIEIFQDPKLNPNGAQLIFATHDVTQLSNKLFRRDEIWFAEKDEAGVSSFYTLSDIKGVRPSVNYEKYYLKGAFGAAPVINKNDFDLVN